MRLTQREADDGDHRAILDLAHRLWRLTPERLNFETSFGTLAWDGGPAVGDAHLRKGGYDHRFRVFERDGTILGWARLSPGYDRIRRMEVWDRAPGSLVWLVDWSEPDAPAVLDLILAWAEAIADESFTTSHTVGDHVARNVLERRGYRPDPSEPFGIYLGQALPTERRPPLGGYVFMTMADLDDHEVRAEAHRAGWPASTRTAADVRATMNTGPYRPDLDIVVTTEDGSPVGAAIIWYDASYEYGEFEPVGTAVDHRGRGVGAAMLRFGLERLAAAGASHAVVGARGDDDYPVPKRLYASVGFRPFATQQIVRKTT